MEISGQMRVRLCGMFLPWQLSVVLLQRPEIGSSLFPVIPHSHHQEEKKQPGEHRQKCKNRRVHLHSLSAVTTG